MNLRRAAVTGATGRIGAPLVTALLAAGVSVRALSRRPAPANSAAEWLQGDLLDPVVLSQLVDGADVVFHAGGLLTGLPDQVMRTLVGGTEAIIEASRAARLVYISSLVVLDTAGHGGPIDPRSPLEPTPERRGRYTQAKAAAEALVRAATAGQDIVIVRPGLVLTEAANEMPASVALRIGPFWLPVGPGSAELPVITARALADDLLVVARNAERGSTVHLIAHESVSRQELFEQLRGEHPAGVVLPLGPLMLGTALASMRYSAAAYRIASAARPHRWLPSERTTTRSEQDR